MVVKMSINRFMIFFSVLLLTISLFLPIFALINVTNTSNVFKGEAIPTAAEYLLLTEVGYRAPAGESEYLEIYNPTVSTINLTNYYISDAVSNYWEIVLGTVTTSSTDWIYKFPNGAAIDPDEYVVITEDNTYFYNRFAFDADYEITDMVNVGTATPTFSMSNAGEAIVLFYWDGISDLVTDVDMVSWDPDVVDRVDKTGVTIDSNYDGDAVTSAYEDETAAASQSPAGPLVEEGESIHRIDYTEGTEVSSGGNGIFGHDETSEDWSNTWTVALEFEVVVPEMPLFLIPYGISALFVTIVLLNRNNPLKDQKKEERILGVI